MFFNHLKTIGVAVGILISASGVEQLATAPAIASNRPTAIPEPYRISALTAQPSLATGAALRSINVGF
jgi:hypothetical protein